MGSSILDALVGIGLAALALACLATAAAFSIRHLDLARQRALALTIASERLEALRAGPRADGSDTIVAAGTRFARTWIADDGRGQASPLAVEVVWGAGRVVLGSRVLP